MVNRVRTITTGFAGGPGVTTMYSTDLASMRAALVNLWGGIGHVMTGNWRAQIDAEGDIINSATGAVEGTWTGAALAPAGGGGGISYAGPVGASITWLTGTVADGTRIRGRTFLVPLPVGSYDDTGTLLDSVLTEVRGACTAFVAAAAPGFSVWHRPRLARAQVGLPGQRGFQKALSAHDGSLAVVTGFIVPDRAQVLRSRRQ